MKSFNRMLFLVALLAVLIRIGFILQVREAYQEPAHDPYLGGEVSVDLSDIRRLDGERGYALRYITDMATYVRIARRVLRGDLFAENHTISPLAPLWVLPLCLWLGHNHIVPAMMAHAVLGGAQVLLIGLVGRRYVGNGAALLAASIAALYDTFIVYDSLPLTETTTNVCLLLVFLTFQRLRESPSWIRGGALGLTAGLAIAAKPTLALLFPLLLLAEWIERGWARVRRVLPLFAVAGAVAALVILPFLLRARALSGEWLFLRSNTGYAILMGNHPGAPGTYAEPQGDYAQRFEQAVGLGPGSVGRRERASVQWAANYWREQPREALGLLWRKIALFASPFEVANNVSTALFRQVSFLGTPVFFTSQVLWPFAILGFFAVICREPRRWTLPLLFSASYAAMIVVTFVVARLRLPVIPFMMLSAGAAVLWLLRGPADHLRVRRWAGAAVLAGLVLTHREEIGNWLVPRLSPGGLPVALAGGRLFRDGEWTPVEGVDYAAIVADPRGRLVKDLVIDPATLESSARSEVWLRCSTRGTGALTVRVNGHELRVDLSPENSEQVRRLRVPVPREWLRPLSRVELLAPEGSYLKVFLDDRYSYGRSFISEHGETIRDERLDTLTYHLKRWARLPRGELQVGIWLR